VIRDQFGCQLTAEDGGYFSGVDPKAKAGDLYRFRLDGGDAFPDPASRFQPEGPHGPSMIVDPHAFAWTDHAWRGVSIEGQVIYEMHIGTFTREGTWTSAMKELPHLASLGITVLEVMPVADFAGEFNWGYDGVDLFAPARVYGSPDDMRRFVDRAHGLGMAVILDVVYNHFGPDGNYMGKFSPLYVSSKHSTDWGEAINFDGEDCVSVREFVVTNARYWIDEYHLDGLRIDATQNMYDDSGDHILAEIGRAVRAGGGSRKTIVIGENEPQDVRLIDPVEKGGYGLDALWNDDLHHSAMVALTKRNDAYYTDYRGTPQEFISSAKWGYLYQGQWYKWQKQRRGTPGLHVPPARLVNFIQNHDQVANSARGQRVHQLSSPAAYRAVTAYLLLAPGTPMLFQGQEFAASSPFLFFADLKPELVEQVRKGRAEFLAQWRSLRLPEMQRVFPDPCSRDSFERSKLDHSERDRNRAIYDLHADCLKLRREDAVLQMQRPRGLDGAVIGPEAFVLRYFGEAHGDRLLIVNLGLDLSFYPSPEPLLAPPAGSVWRPILSTEDPKYGGLGTPELEGEEAWSIPGSAAVFLGPVPSSEPPPKNPHQKDRT
jgi:maltooligosyltrehalose trehalohydrolase